MKHAAQGESDSTGRAVLDFGSAAKAVPIATVSTVPFSMPRVSDGLFRRDMLGPSFINLVTSITGLLLIEKLILDFVMPSLIPSIEAFEVFVGKWPAVCIIATINSVVSFWGFGLIFALPALFKVKSWKIQVTKEVNIQMLLDSLPLISFNFVLQILVGLPVMIYGLPESSYDWRALPSTDVVARDVIVWLLVEEVAFFYVHKWLHENKKMYASVHKIHHTWTAPISLVAIYCHPFEHLVSNLAPVLLGPVLCQSHAAALAIFLAVGTIHTLIVHSGYWFCDDNGMHDEHHAKFNVNFGVMGLMDSLYGTYQLPPGARTHTK